MNLMTLSSLYRQRDSERQNNEKAIKKKGNKNDKPLKNEDIH